MGKTYIIGDLNSRTAQNSDVLDFDKYIDDNTEIDDIEIDFLNEHLITYL